MQGPHEIFLVHEREKRPVLPYLLCVSIGNEGESLIFSINHSPLDLQAIDKSLLFIGLQPVSLTFKGTSALE